MLFQIVKKMIFLNVHKKYYSQCTKQFCYKNKIFCFKKMSQIDEKSLMNNSTSASIEFENSRAVESSKRFDEVVCVKGNKCQLLCVTQGCQKPAIVCSNFSCECNISHSDPNVCCFSNPKIIVKKLEKKRMETPGIKGYLNKVFQEFADWISEFEKQLQSKIHNIGLNDQQGAFLDLTYKGQLKELTGQRMSAVVKQLNKQEQQVGIQVEKLKEKIQESWERIVDPVKEQIKSLEKVINEFRFFLKNQKNDSFVDSKIATTADERKTLLSFFPEVKKPIGSKLLFRASQHNFSAAKFNEICFRKENTVTIVKTNFNKVIGGFTPLEWLGHVLNGHYWEDKSKQSFTFSLTNKDKFEIKNGSIQQVVFNKQYGPVFGSGHEICIADSANANTSSYAHVGASYQNPKYTCGDAASQKLFSGGQNKQFSTLEWQVFQVSFKK